MGEFYIKPFSFCEFFKKDWTRFRLWQETEDRHGEADYKFSGTQSKTPILFDADDYKFLSQFPPAVWSAALAWRYNRAIQIAHDIRMTGGDQAKKISHDENIPDDTNKLSLSDTYQTYKFGGEGKDRVWTGLKRLVKKLEAPVLAHGEHTTVPGYEPGDKGIADIDIDDPAHREAYMKKYGLHDYDLTGLQKADAYIDALPVEKLKIPEGLTGPALELAIKKRRAELKKSAHHSFSGMPVVQRKQATAAIRDWIQLQGLQVNGRSLLGDVGDHPLDPHTNRPAAGFNRSMTPSEIRPGLNTSKKQRAPGDTRPSGVWNSYDYVGTDDGTVVPNPDPDKANEPIKAQKIPIRVPAIQRKLNYTVWNNKNPSDKKQISRDVWMPYLLPGTLIPRLPMTDEQKAALKKRRETPTEGRRGTKTENDSIGGQLNGIEALIQNWDLLSNDQRNTIYDNRRTLWHRLKYKYGRDKQDPFSSPSNHYIGAGFEPNKGQKGTVPTNLDEKKYVELVGKHWAELQDEAAKGVVFWMRDNLGYTGKADVGSAESSIGKGESAPKAGGQTDRSGVLTMMSTAVEDIIGVAAALLASNLQDPLMGISDPAEGLTGRLPKVSDNLAKKRRIWYCKNFAAEVAQKALTATDLSRRARKKGVRGGTQSTNAVVGQGEKAGELGNQLSDTGQAGVQNKRDAAGALAWDNRRATTTTGQAASDQWLNPGIGFLKAFFDGERQKISDKIGELAQLAQKTTDGAADKMSASQEANTAYEEALEELGGVGSDQTRAKALEIFRAKIASGESPYHQFTQDAIATVEELINNIGDNEITDTAEDVDKRLDYKPKHSQWKTELLNQLLSTGRCEYEGDPDDADHEEQPLTPYTIGKPAGKYGYDLADSRIPDSMVNEFAIKFIRDDTADRKDRLDGLGMGKNGVNQYGVPLLKKVLEARGKTVSEDDVVAILSSMGYKPVQMKKPVNAQKQPRVPGAANPAGVQPQSAQAVPSMTPEEFSAKMNDINMWPALTAALKASPQIYSQAAKDAYINVRKRLIASKVPGQALSPVENSNLISMGQALNLAQRQSGYDQ